MNTFLSTNTAFYKVIRTIVQAIISVLVVDGGAYLLEVVSHLPVPEWIKPICFGVLMVILTALMANSGKEEPEEETVEEKEDLPEGYFERMKEEQDG